jgi:hypothetical protein
VIANETGKELKSSGAIQVVVWTEVRGSSTLFDVADMGSSSVEYSFTYLIAEISASPRSSFCFHTMISSYCTVPCHSRTRDFLNSYCDHNDIINEFKSNS